jgi:hypothetical protein
LNAAVRVWDWKLIREEYMSICHCPTLGNGAHRFYDLPSGFEESLELVEEIDDHWESIRRCVQCGQLWHQETICGHADIETFAKTEEKKRKRR